MKTKHTIKGIDGFGLQEYKHYDLKKSVKDIERTENEIYRVVTINHTPASDHKNGKKRIYDWSKVHKNVYEVCCRDLVEWCAGFLEVSETILSITKVKGRKVKKKNKTIFTKKFGIRKGKDNFIVEATTWDGANPVWVMTPKKPTEKEKEDTVDFLSEELHNGHTEYFKKLKEFE